MGWLNRKKPKERLYLPTLNYSPALHSHDIPKIPPPATEIPPPPAPPRRYRSTIDRDSLILAELREIKQLLKLIKDRI